MRTLTGVFMLVVALSCTAAGSTMFSGPYAVANWTVSGTTGSVDLSDAPSGAIAMVSGDSGVPGYVYFTIDAVAAGTVSFDWSFSTADWDPSFDPFGYVLNGNPTQLSATRSVNGSRSFTVASGESFGFYALTLDGYYGSSRTVITNFDAPGGVPEPGTVLLLGAGLALIALWKRRPQAA